MQAVILSHEEFNRVLARLEAIERLLKGGLPQTFLSNLQLQALLGISKITELAWREQGLLPYSQVGGKVYYAYKDVERMMELHRVTLNGENVPPFKGDAS